MAKLSTRSLTQWMQFGSVLLFLIVIPVITPIYFNCQETPRPIIDSLTTILSDSPTSSSAKTLAHNSLIISTLQERESTSDHLTASHEDSLRQARNIYFGILAVLITLVFSKETENKFAICGGLLTFIVLMYLVDVHLIDMLKRESANAQLTHNAVETTVNSKLLDKTWYSLDYRSAVYQLNKAGEPCTRWYRKLWLASRPHFDQIAYYTIPWFLMCTATMLVFFKKK